MGTIIDPLRSGTPSTVPLISFDAHAFMVLILAALPCIWCFVGLKMRWSVLSGKVIAGSANTGLRFVRPADTCTGRKPVRFPCNTAVELASAYFPDGSYCPLSRDAHTIAPRSLDCPVPVGCVSSVDVDDGLASNHVRLYNPRYISKTPWVRVHAKIHGIDPDQIPADFLAEINKSMLFYRTHIVSVGVRASCIELIIDMQMRACNSRTTSEFPLSYQHDNCPPTQRWGSEDGQSLPVLRPGSAVGSDDSPAGISHDTIADSYPQLQSLDWLHLLQQHLPPPAEDAQPAASDSWASLSYTPQVPNFQDLNLEGAPCITECPAVLLLPDSTSPNSPAARLPQSLHVVITHADKSTTGAATGPTLTVRDSAHHLSVVQCLLPREEGDENEVHRFQISFEDQQELADGLVIVECRVGNVMENSWPVLVTSDPDVAAEMVGYLETCQSDVQDLHASGNMSSFIFDFGSCMQYIRTMHLAASAGESEIEAGPGQDSCNLTKQMRSQYLIPAHRTHVHTLACGLLEHTIATGCVHLVRTLVAGLRKSGCTLAWIEQQLADSGSNQSLLQLAKSTGSSSSVWLFSKWAKDEQACTDRQARADAHACTTRIQDVVRASLLSTQTAMVNQSSVQACGEPVADLSNSIRPQAVDQHQSAQSLAVSASSRGRISPEIKTCLFSTSAPQSVVAGSTSQSPRHASSSGSTGRGHFSDRDQNLRYLLWLGQRTLLYTHLWSFLNLLMVMGILLRMSWKKRMLEDGLVLMVYTTLRAVYVLILTFCPQSYVENREALNECLAAARMMVKICACLGGHFCCPPEASGYMMWIDWAIDCVMPTVCEQVWSPISAGLRMFEALITYQLYTHFGIPSLKAAFFAISWNGACIPLAFWLDHRNRRAYADVQPSNSRSVKVGMGR